MTDMSDIFGKIRGGAEKVAKDADRVAHVKRIELDIIGLKRQIEGNYTKLGEITYKATANKEPENTEATTIMSKITDLNDQVKAKEEEIKKINETAQAKPV